MEPSGKAAATITKILASLGATLVVAGLLTNRTTTGSWWPPEIPEATTIVWSFAGFFLFMAIFFSVAVLVSLAEPLLTKEVGPENMAVRGFRRVWGWFANIHLAVEIVFLMFMVALLLYAATQERLVAAILSVTALVSVAVVLWWRRRLRQTKDSERGA